MRPAFIYARRVADLLDRLSDSITTFRYLLYVLVAYALIAAGLSHSHKVPFTPGQIILSSLVLVVICKISNLIFSKLFRVPANHESDILTGLILALILSPADSLNGYLILCAVGVVAMASKYILTINGRHIFNPAALGAYISASVFSQYPSWWIASRSMSVVLVIGGFLIIRKMKRFQMVLFFIGLFLVYRIFLQPSLFGSGGLANWDTTYISIVATPLLFFAPIMLSEPLTSPAKRDNIFLYSFSVAVFYSVNKLHISPEQALLLGNIIAFAIEPNRSLLLKFVKSHTEANSITSYFFKPNQPMKFSAGQYMEWTLPGVGIDARGNRRYLTIASAPTESELMFTVKQPSNASKFKNKLTNLKPGERIVATRLAGEFTLPKDTNQKLAFFAGGVGITPYRSMVKHLLDQQQQRDIALIYSVNFASEIAFADLFTSAKKIGLKTSYITTKETGGQHLHQPLNSKTIAQILPDYKTRLVYISGPQAFVAGLRLSLLELGLSSGNIITDFFPGYN